MEKNLLYKDFYSINDKIQIIIPTVGEIIDREEEYYSLISALTAMPIDFMVILDDIGVDFADIDEFELFLILFQSLQKQDTSMIFKDLDLTEFQLAVNNQNNLPIVYNKEKEIVIDKAIHAQIAESLRKIHGLKKDKRKPANKEAREYMIKRARDKAKRNKNKEYDSQLEDLIVALVNTEQFKYNFQGARELTIYQFNESVKQVVKKIDYDNRMRGVYAGTVSVKDLSQDDLNWLIHK